MRASKQLPVLCLLIFSCSRQADEVVDRPEAGNLLVEEFQQALKSRGMIVFKDSSGLGATIDGAILELHFAADAKLTYYTFGYGLSSCSGSYSLPENNRIHIHLKRQKWPELLLSKEGGKFLLRRADGLLSLTNHVVRPEGDDMPAISDDGDLYPEAALRIFPFTGKTECDDKAVDPSP